MGKFRKRILVSCITLSLIGGIGLSICLNQESDTPTVNNRGILVMYIQNESGEYSVSSSKEFPKEGYELNLEKSSCKNGGILSQDETTKGINLRTSKADQCTLYFDKEPPTLKYYLDNVVKKTESPNFAEAATTDETADGLYSMIDDSGKPSYYYRGAVANNYVKFGKNKTGQDMYWRIIRFNGDGSVRMQYDGAGTANDPNYLYTRGFAMTNQQWNTKNDDAKYVGWMFGGAQGTASSSKVQAQTNSTPSEIKTAVDTWYEENIKNTGYHDYVADEIFCNDRSIPGQSVTKWTRDTGYGYAKNITGYGAFGRFMTGNNSTSVSANENPQPSFVCKQARDKFTVSTDSGGNGKLMYPVGLITADEIEAAGSGKWGTANTSYYLNKGLPYWSFSPSIFSGSSASVFGVYTSGTLYYGYVQGGVAVAPVINIKPEYVSQLKGTGKSIDPYRMG